MLPDFPPANRLRIITWTLRPSQGFDLAEGAPLPATRMAQHQEQAATTATGQYTPTRRYISLLQGIVLRLLKYNGGPGNGNRVRSSAGGTTWPTTPVAGPMRPARLLRRGGCLRIRPPADPDGLRLNQAVRDAAHQTGLSRSQRWHSPISDSTPFPGAAGNGPRPARTRPEMSLGLVRPGPPADLASA